MDKEVKQESSIPVQARVGMVSLAEMAKYWESQGYMVRSMSQLVAWSLDLLCEVLRQNQAMPLVIETVAEAHRELEQRGLYQGSLKNRAFKKIGASLRFETMRREGIDPKSYTPMDYGILHNKRSVEPSPIASNYLSDEDLRAIARKKIDEVRRQKQMEMHEERKRTKEAIAEAKVRGVLAEESVKNETEVGVVREGMTEEEFYTLAQKRDKRVQEMENSSVEEQLKYLREQGLVEKE